MFVSLTTIVGLGRFFTILQMTSETNDQQIFVLLCAAQSVWCVLTGTHFWKCNFLSVDLMSQLTFVQWLNLMAYLYWIFIFNFHDGLSSKKQSRSTLSATTPSWRYCTSAHVDTQTEKVDLGIAIFPTLPELLFVVFSVADMISWFWASVFSLRRHGYSMVSGIVLDERRKWICCCLCIYLQPLKANMPVCWLGTKAGSFMWQMQCFTANQYLCDFLTKA